MTFDDILDGSSVFIDSNTFIYRFGSDPQLTGPCLKLIGRAERQQIAGFTSAQILGDVAHRLMAVEAGLLLGRPPAGMIRYLQRRPAVIQQLTHFRQAVETVLNGPIRVVAITPTLVADAMLISQQHGLLHNDALIVAVMQLHGLTNLASHDADFDRVPGLARFAPA